MAGVLTLAAVSGATGFIGQHLCRALSASGVQIRALGRSQPSFACDFVAWNLTDPLNQDALAGVDVIFHLAGKAHALAETSQDEDEYFRINTEATRTMLEAAKGAGVRAFIYFSSVKAVGEIEGLMDESISVEADTPYGRSKRASEKLVFEGSYVPHPVVIRPAMVYGNTAKGNLPKMVRAIRRGRFPPFPPVNNCRSMVHVEDVVQAAILAAEQPKAAGQTYIVTDGREYSTRQIYEWICEALNKPVPGWHVPLSLLRVLGYIGDAVGALRGRRFVFDSDALDKLVSSACYSSAKIEQQLGFTPQRHLQHSLSEIVGYLETQS